MTWAIERTRSEPSGRQGHILGRALLSSTHMRRVHLPRSGPLQTVWLSGSCPDTPVFCVSQGSYIERRKYLSSRGPYFLQVFMVCRRRPLAVEYCLIFAIFGRGHVRRHGGPVRRLPRLRSLVRANHDENRPPPLNRSYRAGHV